MDRAITEKYQNKKSDQFKRFCWHIIQATKYLIAENRVHYLWDYFIKSLSVNSINAVDLYISRLAKIKVKSTLFWFIACFSIF